MQSIWQSGVLDPQGPIGAAERLILINATVIMLAVIVLSIGVMASVLPPVGSSATKFNSIIPSFGGATWMIWISWPLVQPPVRVVPYAFTRTCGGSDSFTRMSMDLTSKTVLVAIWVLLDRAECVIRRDRHA